jgi:creatine kinase/arginine kinase
LNGEDHLNISVVLPGGNLSEAFKRLEKALTLIEAEKTFARTSHLGYLTCCPTNLGTAMLLQISV